MPAYMIRIWSFNYLVLLLKYYITFNWEPYKALQLYGSLILLNEILCLIFAQIFPGL